MNLGIGDGDGWGTGIIWVVEAIASGFHADLVGLCFLRLYSADKVDVCDIIVFWNEMSACRLDGVGAFYAFFGRAIFTYSAGKEVTPFVSVASVPFGYIWYFEKCLE